MEYPVWQLGALGGGLLIAIIATVHVYVAHFAVGGGLFLVLAERMGLARNSQAILDYTKSHAKFFMLLTMVFGGLTGVAIWFTIALLAPGATSELIHVFVFGFATEWVFFLGEITALLVYYYSFGRMNPADHQRAGLLYFVFAWLSLFTITGIIGYMLTPGQWLETRNYWDAFFNPSLWPAVALRTCMALSFAGLFGFFTACRIKDPEAREIMVRACALWTCVPVLGAMPAGWWYLKTLPPGTLDRVTRLAGETWPYVQAVPLTGALVLLGGLLMIPRLPGAARTVLALVLLLAGQLYMGAFEYAREAGRRPFLVTDHLYSTQIDVKDVPALLEGGVLPRDKWSPVKAVDPADPLKAGRVLFDRQCLPCHSIGGPVKDIRPRTAAYTVEGMDCQLDGLGRINTAMPPFVGTREERMALSRYIVQTLNGRSGVKEAAVAGKDLPLNVPSFDGNTAEYALFAWSGQGMYAVTDGDSHFVLREPGADLRAMLVRRGPSPEMTVEGVVLRYGVEPGFEYPTRHSDFWKAAKTALGRDLAPNTGLAGKGVSGTLDPRPETKTFEAPGVPILPYPDQGGFNPYPLVTVEARAKDTDALLIKTRAVLPVSTEMGCKNCHGGTWKVEGLAGISEAAGRGVLATHDQMSGTKLAAQAAAGKPVRCQSCHGDQGPAKSEGQGAGKPGSLLSLSAAVHGLHANYMTGRGAEACASCHPSRPDGPTRSLRGRHGQAGMDCVNCHGAMEDHSLALLKHELAEGRTAAERLMRHVKPRSMALAEIAPRQPWVQQPDCLNCHKGFGAPETDSAFNTWTSGAAGLYKNRRDEMNAVPCSACHNAAHAVYPTLNPYGRDRDNIQPLQYMGFAGTMGEQGKCTVCHQEAMEGDAHHPNLVR